MVKLGMDGKILGDLIGAGSQIGGALLGRRSQQAGLDEQKREFDIQNQRRNQLLRLALPGLLANLGYSSGSVPGIMGSNQVPQLAQPKPEGHGTRNSILGLLGGIGAGVALPRILGSMRTPQLVPYGSIQE